MSQRQRNYVATDVMPTHYCQQQQRPSQLEVWANAQRDGRPAVYRWHPLFNAAKFG